jgi:hypothetical protein
MSEARPMDQGKRIDAYRAQHGGALTPRQRRRAAHKRNRAAKAGR